MCGIAGILRTPQADDIDIGKVLATLRRSLSHRGPDDSGCFVSSNGLASLVHTRLAILDVSSAGHQPMHSADGRFTITFNGEIYNYGELRSEMEDAGEHFLTGTDTEVLLRLYALVGRDCVRRLRGMFAFAIWDAVRKTCFLARDRFGIKPLYYCHSGVQLVFASEVKALLSSGVVARRLSPAGVAGYFRHGSVPEPDTLVEGVRCLQAGHSLLWEAGRLEEREYQGVTFLTESPVDHASAAREVRAALKDSVEHHFLSDVPVGMFLSGGIDSTALLALASEGRRRTIRTFCIRFAEREFDEGDLAGRTASHFGADHSEWRLGADEGKRLFSDFVSRIDQPSVDGFNTFIVSKFAHDQGMKVVLSGVGGDELFGGYPSFHHIPKLVRAAKLFETIGAPRRTAGAVLERFASRERWRRLGQFLQVEPSVFAAYQAYRGIFVTEDANRLTLGYTRSLAGWLPELPITEQPTTGDQISALEMSLYMRNQLLRDSDAMSMAWGLELRVPFVDSELVDHVASVPASLRLQPGKKMLLAAVPEIPEWVLGQPKRGFVFPFARWCDSEWEGLGQIANRFNVHARTWYQRWAMFLFEHWCREHGMS